MKGGISESREARSGARLFPGGLSCEEMGERICCNPPEVIRVGNNAVHVWKGLLDVDSETIKRFFTVLSGEEKQRSSRFHLAQHGRQYIAAHGMLRSILGEYLEIDPKALTFSVNPYGKPYLCSDQKNGSILFNLSHSHNLCIIAVSSGSEIGIDIEYVNRDIDVLEIAERCFSRREIEELGSLRGDLQRRAFYRCWTRKEAYLKGKGKGLSMDLRRFEVSMLSAESAAIVSSDDSPEDVGRWHLFDIEPYPRYIGALAVAGDPTV